jgi:hypothetical protein
VPSILKQVPTLHHVNFLFAAAAIPHYTVNFLLAAAAEARNDTEGSYGLFSPNGFFSDHNEMFNQCERRLLEPHHDYAGINFTGKESSLFAL